MIFDTSLVVDSLPVNDKGGGTLRICVFLCVFVFESYIALLFEDFFAAVVGDGGGGGSSGAVAAAAAAVVVDIMPFSIYVALSIFVG